MSSSAETPLAALEVTKTVDATSVAPGSTVHYTVTVANTGNADIPESELVTVTDDLSDVLDDASYDGNATADIGTATVTGTELAWTGGLAVGELATITYSVTVNRTAAAGATLVNLVVSDPTIAAISGDGGSADRTASTTSTVVQLALTGANPVWLAALAGGLLLLVGFGLVIVIGRKRRVAHDQS